MFSWNAYYCSHNICIVFNAIRQDNFLTLILTVKMANQENSVNTINISGMLLCYKEKANRVSETKPQARTFNSWGFRG